MLKMKSRLSRDQSGLVSIVVTMLLILVLTLVIIAFMRISQREQRQALDRQLNTEAFYAAETGVNDVTRRFKEAPAGDPIFTDESQVNNCTPSTMAGFSNQVDGTNIVYSCLLIDPTPPSLEYSVISKGQSKVVPIDLETPDSGVNTITIFWMQPDTSATFGCPSAPPFPSNWPGGCTPGVLRIDAVRTDGSFDRNELLSSTATGFAVPRNGGGAGTISFGSASGGAPAGSNQGVIAASGCSSALTPDHPKYCEVRITGVNLGQRYFLRLTPLYRSAEVTICAPNCTNAARDFKNAQVSVDSTGRASDVLRRIQARVSIDKIPDNSPLGGLESSGLLCKRISIIPPSTVTNGCP